MIVSVGKCCCHRSGGGDLTGAVSCNKANVTWEKSLGEGWTSLKMGEDF